MVLIFAKLYKTPLEKANKMLKQLIRVKFLRSSGKNINPLRAIGSLFRAPTMLYDVEVAAREHQAVEKLIKKAKMLLNIKSAYSLKRIKLDLRLIFRLTNYFLETNTIHRVEYWQRM